MIDTVPVTIGGREMQLRLDMGAMRQAERVTPGLRLLSNEKGWEQVGESASAFLGLLYGCLRHEDPRPTVEWLEDNIGIRDLQELQARVVLLFGLGFAAGGEEGRQGSDPFETLLASPGTGSGPTPSTISGSPTPSSGTAPPPDSSSSPSGTERPSSGPTTAQGS